MPRLRGTVSHHSEPVVGALVRADCHTDEDFDPEFETFSDVDGSYELIVDVGRCSVRAETAAGERTGSVEIETHWKRDVMVSLSLP